MADLKEALKGDDAEAITAKTNALAQLMKFGEAMYKQQKMLLAGPMAVRRRWRLAAMAEGRRRRAVHRGRRRQENKKSA
jgi:hypothetical protein